MEESTGAKFALQIAIHTLRDRCKNLQHRISVLEEENLNLRMVCSRKDEVAHSLTELDNLRVQVVELTEQKDQMQGKIKMVTNENRELWKKLGTLVSENKNLDEQLHKINETINQHTTPQHKALIRSKTFTQEEPHTLVLQKNLELNEKISLELENVSLKLTDSFSKQKQEFERIYSEIAGLQSNEIMISEHFGFCFDDKIEDDMYEDFKYMLDDFKMLKNEILQQREVLQKNLENVDFLKSKEIPKCKICDIRRKINNDKSTSTVDIPKIGVDKCTEVLHIPAEGKLNVTSQKSPQDVEKICPICSKIFGKTVDFLEFQQHVEDHFLLDNTGVL